MSDQVFWIAAPLLAIGTFLLRFMFLGYFNARRPSAEWARALKYTPAAILPALAAPQIVFDATGALQSDPARIMAASAAILIGVATRDVLWSVLGGMSALWLTAAVLAI